MVDASATDAAGPASSGRRWTVPVVVASVVAVALLVGVGVGVLLARADAGEPTVSPPAGGATSTVAAETSTAPVESTEGPSTTAPPSTAAATDPLQVDDTEPAVDGQGRLIVGADRVGPARFGDTSEDALAGLADVLSSYPDVQPAGDPACANPLIMNLRWPELLLSTDRNAEIRWFFTDGPNFATRSGITVGSTSEEVEASLPVRRVPGDEMYPPTYDVVGGPDEGLHIEIGSDERVTRFFAGGNGLDCVGAHEGG